MANSLLHKRSFFPCCCCYRCTRECVVCTYKNLNQIYVTYMRCACTEKNVCMCMYSHPFSPNTLLMCKRRFVSWGWINTNICHRQPVPILIFISVAKIVIKLNCTIKAIFFACSSPEQVLGGCEWVYVCAAGEQTNGKEWHDTIRCDVMWSETNERYWLQHFTYYHYRSTWIWLIITGSARWYHSMENLIFGKS